MEKSNENCPFCNLPQEKIIAENEYCKAFYDSYPVSKGHTLIIPKRHVANYFDLNRQEKESIDDLLTKMKATLDAQYHPDGYNIGVNVNKPAGQSVFHVHVHLIPRYIGDVEEPKGGVRGVIPGKQRY